MITHKTLNKRHFQLLEIMVAMFILLVCVAPIFHIYVSMNQQQKIISRANKRDQLISYIHAHITEQLYKQAISLPEETSDEQPSTDVSIPPLDGIDTSFYLYRGVLTRIKPKPKTNNQKKNTTETQDSKQLWQLDIYITDLKHKPDHYELKHSDQNGAEKKYKYLIYVQRAKI